MIEQPDAMLAKLIDDAVAGLTGAARTRATAELRAHIDDALDAGLSPSEICASFGDPAVTSELLRRSPPPIDRMRVVTRALVATVAAACVAAAFYGVTARRLGTFDAAWTRPSPALDSAARLGRLRAAAESLLAGPGPPHLLPALRIADEAWSADAAFGRLVAVTIVADVIPVADRLLAACALTSSDRADFAARLAPWTNSERRVDVSELQAWFDRVVAGSFPDETAPVGRGLRTVQAMKGVLAPSARARLLEPFYFARAVTSTDVWMTAASSQLRHADRASRVLASDLDPLVARLRKTKRGNCMKADPSLRSPRRLRS